MSSMLFRSSDIVVARSNALPRTGRIGVPENYKVGVIDLLLESFGAVSLIWPSLLLQ